MKFLDHLFIALNLEHSYTPGDVANFAVDSGFLEVIQNQEPLRLAKQRIRISAGRFCQKNLPRTPDVNEGLRMSWFGWRWQGHDYMETARQDLSQRIGPVLGSLDPGEAYALSDLLDIHRDQWQREVEYVIKALLTHYSRVNGLNIGEKHVTETWRAGL